VNDTSLTFDIYYPEHFDRHKPLPLVIFNNGVGSMDITKWGIYKDWAKLIAASGMIAVNHLARPGSAFQDDETLADYLFAHSNELGIDQEKIALWTCSANARAGTRMAIKTRPAIFKVLVVYYGIMDSLGELRQDLPTLVVRAGLDVQFINTGIDNFVQSSLQQDARIELINFLHGMHAFDIFTKTEESKAIVKKTVDFLKENLNNPVSDKKFTLTSKNFMWLMANGQSQRAIDEFRKARTMYRADPNYNQFYNGVLREQPMNANAYYLLQHQQQPEALETFKLIVETYPESANAYDGLADGYEALGNKTEALRYSKIALEKLTQSKDIDPQFAEAVRRSAEDKIKRLQ
jgi:tetratricopeptide (TPR) repeat protein